MRKNILLLMGSIFLVGFISGFHNSLNLDNLTGILVSYKMLYQDLLIIILLFVLSIMGLPAYLCYLAWDLFSLGVLGFALIATFKLKGLTFLLLYILIFKVIKYLFISLIAFYSYKYSKHFYRFIFNKLGASINNIKLYFKKLLVMSIIHYLGVVLYVLIFSKVLLYLANYMLF